MSTICQGQASLSWFYGKHLALTDQRRRTYSQNKSRWIVLYLLPLLSDPEFPAWLLLLSVVSWIRAGCFPLDLFGLTLPGCIFQKFYSGMANSKLVCNFRLQLDRFFCEGEWRWLYATLLEDQPPEFGWRFPGNGFSVLEMNLWLCKRGFRQCRRTFLLLHFEKASSSSKSRKKGRPLSNGPWESRRHTELLPSSFEVLRGTIWPTNDQNNVNKRRWRSPDELAAHGGKYKEEQPSDDSTQDDESSKSLVVDVVEMIIDQLVEWTASSHSIV